MGVNVSYTLAFPLIRFFLSNTGNDLPSEINVNVTVNNFEGDSTVKANVQTKLEGKDGNEDIFLLHEGSGAQKVNGDNKKNQPYN